MDKIIVIIGPTASGKSAAALKLAQKLNGVILSADSMQIYKGMDIGTAKPTPDEQKLVKHYLIDIAKPDEEYSVGQYIHDAQKVINALKNTPKILVGGTGLYIKSLLFNQTHAGVKKDIKLRQKYLSIAEQYGSQYLHGLLKEVDPESAGNIHPNDTKRIIRALEIFELTGKPKSSHRQILEPKYDYIGYFINPDREKLYKKIEERVDDMIAKGLFDEVKGLLERGIPTTSQSMQAIGYKESIMYLQGQLDKVAAIELIKKNTRNYAKRQLTFFRAFTDFFIVENGEQILKDF